MVVVPAELVLVVQPFWEAGLGEKAVRDFVAEHLLRLLQEPLLLFDHVLHFQLLLDLVLQGLLLWSDGLEVELLVLLKILVWVQEDLV